MYALYDIATGRIKQFQSGPDCPDNETGAIDIGDAPPRDLHQTHYVQADTLTKRPKRPVIPATGTAPVVITRKDWSETAMIVVSNEAGDSLIVTENLKLTDPGWYILTVTAEFPDHTYSHRIEVTP